jgi:uncharacterized protein YndB with AHSA1/START domain
MKLSGSLAVYAAVFGALALAGMPAANAEATKVSSAIEIPAAPDKVWAALGDYCGIASWHPAIAKCELSEDKKTRTLTTGDGGKFVEPLETWDDGAKYYTYRIEESPLPVENYVSTIRIKGTGDKSTVEWSSTFDPKGVSAEEASKIITGIYKAGLDNLAKKAM